MRAQQVWGDYRLKEEDLLYLLQPLVNLKQLYIYRIHTPEFSAHWIDCIKLAEKCNRQLEDLEVVTENANSFMPPHSNPWIQNLRSLKQLQRLALLPGNDGIMDSYFRGMTESTPHKHQSVDQMLDVSSIQNLVGHLPNLRHLEVGIKGKLFRHDFSLQQQFLRLVCSSKLRLEDVKPRLLWMHFFTTFRNVLTLDMQANKNPNISWVHITAAITVVLHELELLDLSTNFIRTDQLYFFVPR